MRSTVLALTLSLFAAAPLAQTPDLEPATTTIAGPAPRLVAPGTQIGDAPSDAIVLFDGESLEQWQQAGGGEPQWQIDDGAVTVTPGSSNIQTKQNFSDVQLHIEWRTPPAAQHTKNLKRRRGQEIKKRVEAVMGMDQYMANSGIFLQARYEVQVLETYGLKTYVNGQAGSIYKQHIPLVTASRSPGSWQSYDIIFQAPRFGKTGAVVVPGSMTVLLNGVLIQNHVALWGPTEFRGLPSYEAHGPAPIELQSHVGVSPVSYRNIWVREL